MHALENRRKDNASLPLATKLGSLIKDQLSRSALSEELMPLLLKINNI
jgi:hypothetical protein